MWKSVTQWWVLCQFFWVIIYLMPTTLQNLYWMRMFISRGWRSHYVKNKWRTRDGKTILSKNQRPPQWSTRPCLVHSLLTFIFYHSSLCLLCFSHTVLFTVLWANQVGSHWISPFFFRKCSSPKYTNGYLLSLSLCLNVTCSMMPSLTCYLKLHLCPPPAPLALLLYTIALNTV